MKNLFQKFLTKNREALSSRTGKVGTYTLTMSAVVLAILIAANVFVSSLPTTMTQFDISAARLYSVTSATKVVINNLDQDVTIYWICQNEQEDDVVERLLNVYDDLSDHVTVERKDPDMYPTFASQYTDETVDNNSLVVVCGDKYRYIAYSDMYETDEEASYYYQTSVATAFDGEGLITAAINYVIADDLPKMYIVTGHDEADLSDEFTNALTQANIETADITLAEVEEIPEDADALLINSPQSDFSEDEITLLESYMENGGKLCVLSGPEYETDLTNLQRLLTDNGITPEEGIVLESDENYYSSGYQYMLMPEVQSSEITDPLIDEDEHVLAAIAGGLTIGDVPEGYTVTSLLMSSETSYSKVAGYSLTTYDKEDGDIDGPLTLAVSVEDTDSEGKMVWIDCDNMMVSSVIESSSGANTDFVMNSLYYLVGKTNSISIASKSLDYNTLNISTSSATLIKIWIIGVIPAVYLLAGILEVVTRRKKQ